jgi:opine dehydrogenase
MSILPRYLIIGAGNGGCALAAELVLRVRNVMLFDYPAFESRLAPLRAPGGMHVESRVAHFTRGVGVHFARLPELSTDITGAAATDVIIVVVPGQHHAQVIEAIPPHLRPGHLVLLNPGGVGGALLWADALRRAGHQDILLAQAADLVYAGFRTPEAKVVVADKKVRASLGVFPLRVHDRAMALLAHDFPEFVLAADVLEAGLQGPGMLVHPLPMRERRAPHAAGMICIRPMAPLGDRARTSPKLSTCTTTRIHDAGMPKRRKASAMTAAIGSAAVATLRCPAETGSA